MVYESHPRLLEVRLAALYKVARVKLTAMAAPTLPELHIYQQGQIVLFIYMLLLSQIFRLGGAVMSLRVKEVFLGNPEKSLDHFL